MAIIVICEDDATIRKLVGRILSSDGHEVLLAADGREGLDLIKKIHPDLVITDNFMPKVDGDGVLTAVKNDPDLTSVPLVLLSAGNPNLDDLRNAGWLDFIQKPFSPAEFKTKVNEIVARLTH
jgi:CheY-like chemotaxis protein